MECQLINCQWTSAILQVNGNLVSQMHVLANAEVVEIITYNVCLFDPYYIFIFRLLIIFRNDFFKLHRVTFVILHWGPVWLGEIQNTVEYFFELLKEELARVEKSHHFISWVSDSSHREVLAYRIQILIRKTLFTWTSSGSVTSFHYNFDSWFT